VRVEDQYVEIYTKPQQLEKVREALKQNNLPIASSEVSMVPKTMVELKEKDAIQTLKLLDKLEELDEVQHVSSNADFSDSVLEKYRAGV
jgi:transcriptional/translational regulatory protein YebC/TACO1